MRAGKLILLPNVLDTALPHELFLPSAVGSAVAQLSGVFVESEKEARRYLRRFLSHDQMAALPLKPLNEHTSDDALEALVEPLLQGETWGLVSDAGLPCIADPGAPLVWLCQQQGIFVEALVGPSSLILALQLSGFSGQNFAFRGYLPREEIDLEHKIKELESKARGETQIWIEAPYRSAKMLELLKKILQPSTLLCVAASLTTSQQKIASHPLQQWKSLSFSLGKEPAIFLLYRN
ncbi:MAG: SAM-dependent methyltransferase [Chlamydiia bacterium]|nr:SAM-dependent methyltransferase [Chlamydiia bacterium]